MDILQGRKHDGDKEDAAVVGGCRCRCVGGCRSGVGDGVAAGALAVVVTVRLRRQRQRAVVGWEAAENWNILTAVSVIDGDAGFKTSCHASIMYSDVKSAERLLDLNHSHILFAHVGHVGSGITER